jgi:hypothetical protein
MSRNWKWSYIDRESGSSTNSDYTLEMKVKVIIRWQCRWLYNEIDRESIIQWKWKCSYSESKSESDYAPYNESTTGSDYTMEVKVKVVMQ